MAEGASGFAYSTGHGYHCSCCREPRLSNSRNPRSMVVRQTREVRWVARPYGNRDRQAAPATGRFSLVGAPSCSSARFHRAERGRGPIRRNGPKRAAHKLGRSPFRRNGQRFWPHEGRLSLDFLAGASRLGLGWSAQPAPAPNGGGMGQAASDMAVRSIVPACFRLEIILGRSRASYH